MAEFPYSSIAFVMACLGGIGIFAALFALIVANVVSPRRINPRTGFYVREWWRFGSGSGRGGGDWPGGFYG